MKKISMTVVNLDYCFENIVPAAQEKKSKLKKQNRNNCRSHVIFHYHSLTYFILNYLFKNTIEVTM